MWSWQEVWSWLEVWSWPGVYNWQEVWCCLEVRGGVVRRCGVGQRCGVGVSRPEGGVTCRRRCGVVAGVEWVEWSGSKILEMIANCCRGGVIYEWVRVLWSGQQV